MDHVFARLRSAVPLLTAFTLTMLAVVAAGSAPAKGDAQPGKDGLVAFESVLRESLSEVAARYLEPLRLEALVTAALTGLTTLDPALAVERRSNGIALHKKQELLGRFSSPFAMDTAGWAALCRDVVAMARTASPAVAQADEERLIEVTIDGALRALDPFSRYARGEEARDHRARRDGYAGIGARFRFAGGVATITEIVPETPAERAGLRTGDQLTRIDEADVATLTASEVSHRLHGPIGTRLSLTVARPSEGRLFQLALDRTYVPAQTVQQRFANGYLTLALSSFNRTTADDVLSAILAAAGSPEGLRGVVLDLRGNPGGLLKQAIDIADFFLSDGRIAATRGRHPGANQVFDAGGRDVAPGVPVVVVIDGASASAAEVLAAALADHRRAVLIGTNTFGKGVVQTVIPLSNDGELTLTWSRIYRPAGEAIGTLGVTPALCLHGQTGADVLAMRAAGLQATWSIQENALSAREEGGGKGSAPCPAERREDDIDLTIAERLLRDRRTYWDLLDQSQPLVRSVSPGPLSRSLTD